MINKLIATAALSLAMSTTVVAHEDNKQLTVLLQDVDIVLQLLGATQYYADTCAPLTPTGEFYRELAMNAHDIKYDTLDDYEQFKRGYKILSTYPSCSAMITDFKYFGIEDFVEEQIVAESMICTKE
jgi:hypothetical protein